MFLQTIVIPGSEIQRKRPHEVLEIRDDGRGYLVSAAGGPLIITGWEKNIFNVITKIFLNNVFIFKILS